MALLDEAREIRAAIEAVCREVVREETRDCFRVKKAVVVYAPNGSTCTVKLVGDTENLALPYSSAVASVSSGAVVWVAILGDSMRNAIVWEKAKLR